MKIAASTDTMINLIEWYNIWKDSKVFYGKSAPGPLLINDPDGVVCYHHMDVKSINADPSKLIVIDCLTEALNHLEYFNRYRKDRHYVIFSNGTWSRDHWNLPIDYTLIWYPFFLCDMADTYNSPFRFCYHLDKEYHFDYPKPCGFVSTIGNVRPLRTRLVERLQQNISYQNYILRYSGQDLASPSKQYDVVNFVEGEFDPYVLIFEKYYHSVSQSLPIKMHNQSYFNLIVETDLEHNHSFFLTEKTIKSVITGQPFVVFSNMHHLKNLKEIGFKTFSECWDESYDDIEDLDLRIDAIVKLCEFLGNGFDWQSNRSKLEEIKRHNRHVFQNLGPFMDRCFRDMEDSIKELG